MQIYLHLGQNTIVRTASISGVFDLDNTTGSKRTREYLARAQREGRVVERPRDRLPLANVPRHTAAQGQPGPAGRKINGKKGMTISLCVISEYPDARTVKNE